MTTTEIVRPAYGLERAHRAYPPFKMLVIPFQPIVQIFRRAMLHVGQESAQGRRIAFCLIRRHLARSYCGGLQGTCEAGFGCSSVTPVAQVDINDLPMFSDRPKQVVPVFRDLDIRFIDPPSATNSGPERLGCRGEARGKGSDPIIDGTRVDGHAPLSQPLHDIGVAEPIADIQRTARAITSSGKAWLENALVERAVKRQ